MNLRKAGAASATTVSLEVVCVIREQDRYLHPRVLISLRHPHDFRHRPECCEGAAGHMASTTAVVESKQRLLE